jgi:hypothetical protein
MEGFKSIIDKRKSRELFRAFIKVAAGDRSLSHPAIFCRIFENYG